MKILVCGTRGDSLDPLPLVSELNGLHHYNTIDLVVQGFANSGGDKIGREWADNNGVMHTGPYYKPDWERYGKRAGFVRNELMLDNEEPDLTVAYWDGKSNGTRHTIEESIKRGIPVRIVPCGRRQEDSFLNYQGFNQ